MKDSNTPTSVVNVTRNDLGYSHELNNHNPLLVKLVNNEVAKNIFPEEKLGKKVDVKSDYRTVEQNSGLYAIKNPNETNPDEFKIPLGVGLTSSGFSYSRIIKLGVDNKHLQGVLSDQEIKDFIDNKIMEITPFVSEKVSTLDGKKCLSYGLSSMGYDARLHEDVYFIKKDLDAKPIDPKNMSLDEYTKAKLHTDETGTFVLVPPHTFVLGRTVETFKIPNFIIATVTSKSTYARCGIPTIATPIEPGFFGTITLEFINSTEHYNKLYIGEGVVQLLFHVGSVVEKDYAASGGKYNGQTDVRVAQV